MAIPVVLLIASLCSLCSTQQIFVGPKYQAESNGQKFGEIGAQVTKDKTPGSYPTLELPEIFLESMPVSFDTEADDMPYQFLVQRRPKLIHSVGGISSAKWVPLTNNYTGVFQGCSNLFIRFSSATAPANASRGFTPGISLKCTRTGVPSTNILAMFSLEGQDGFNFFKHDLTNHPPDINPVTAPFILQQLRAHFETASKWPTMIGLTSFASYDENGKFESKPQFPFRLIFHPVTAVHNSYPDGFPSGGFEYVLGTNLKPGPLYNVYAQDLPSDTQDKFLLIGRIDLTASSTTTNFGDNYMFFQHTRMENDFAYYPQWVPVAQQIIQQQQKTDYYTFPDLPFN